MSINDDLWREHGEITKKYKDMVEKLSVNNEQLVALLTRSQDIIERQGKMLADARQDAVVAAGELLVEVPEPGTDMARLLIANVLMRRRLQDTDALIRRSRDVLRATISGPEDEQAQRNLLADLTLHLNTTTTTRTAT